MRKKILTEIGLYVADISVYVLVATIDPVELLLQVLIDELVAIEQLVQTTHRRAAYVITVTIHIIYQLSHRPERSNGEVGAVGTAIVILHIRDGFYKFEVCQADAA